MEKKFYLLILLVLLFNFSKIFGQKVFIGIGYSSDENFEKSLIVAKQRALADLVNQLRVEVKTNFEQNVLEKDDIINEKTSYRIRTLSNLPLLGVRWKILRKKEATSVQAILNQDSSRIIYRNSINSNIEKINELASQQNCFQSLRALININGMLEKVERESLVFLLIGGQKEELIKLLYTKNIIEDAISKRYSIIPENLDDAAHLLAQRLLLIESAPCDFKIGSFTLNNTKYCSSFSEYFKELLNSAFYKTLACKNLIDSNAENHFSIEGTYWVNKDSVDIFLSMQYNNNSNINSTKVSIPKKWVINKNLNLEPENIYTLEKTESLFSFREMAYGQIKINFWSDKGTDAVAFHNGEEVKLYAMVNMPVYLRVIYYLAKGDKTLIYENYHIDESMVNQTINLPPLVCAPPFGVEKFQLFASTEMFPTPQIEKKVIDGVMYYLISEDSQNLLNRTRGMLRKHAGKYAERIITVTTME